MKALVFFLSLLLLVNCGQDTKTPAGPAQPEGPAVADTTRVAVFADTSLEVAVREALKRPTGPLTQVDFASLIQLVARGRGIASLAGIDSLKNLQVLDLADNQIQDLSPLSILAHLTYLDLENNQIQDLSPLAALAQLQSLILSFNAVDDISPLLGLAHLRSVELSGNPLGDPLSGSHQTSLRSRGVQVVFYQQEIEVGISESDTTASHTPADLISGTKILFCSRADKYSDGEIFTMDADGEDWDKLMFSIPPFHSPTWSPDGKKIACALTSQGMADEVWMVGRDGTTWERLFRSRMDDRLRSLAWSPDGQRFVLVKGRQRGIEVEDWQAYVMSTRGTDTLRLTDSAGWNDDPCWSPDGTRIAFVSNRTGKTDIYVMNTDGGNLLQLTDDPVGAYDPAWSPDGKRIAFVSGRDGNPEIYAMQADGSNPVRLTQEPAVDDHPTWSPDSQKIAFHTYRDSNGEIYVMQADGTELANLTRATSDEWYPEWSPY